MEGKLPGGRPGGSVWHDAPGCTERCCPPQTHDPAGRPQIPQDPQQPCQPGREARGHLHHLLLGFLLRLLLPRAWGVGRCLCCRGDSSSYAQHGKKTQLYQALKSPWLNVRASLLIPLQKEKTPGIPSSGGKYVISDSFRIFL